MDPITDINIEQTYPTEDGTFVRFSFVKPSGSIGGYLLYTSLDGVDYSYYHFRVDETLQRQDFESTYDDSGLTYYEVIFDHTYDGQQLYVGFYAISTKWELSTFVSGPIFYTCPAKVDNVFVVYDGYKNTLTWDALSTSSGLHKDISGYNLYYEHPTILDNVSLSADNTVLYSESFTVGAYVVVRDYMKYCMWCGYVTTAGQFSLTDTCISAQSDISPFYYPIIDNLRIYLVTGSNYYLDTVNQLSYEHTLSYFNTLYVYSVQACMPDGKEGRPEYYPVFSIELTQAIPYLRNSLNSPDLFLNNKYWDRIRSTLIDDAYYKNLDPYAIPYDANNAVVLSGYLGISNCYVDVFAFGNYLFTTSTGDYGEFYLSYSYSLSPMNFSFQARDKHNLQFSRISNTYRITAKNIYTYYSIFGYLFHYLEDEALEIETKDMNISTCRYETYEHKFSPFVGFYKETSETEADFMDLVSTCYLLFTHVTFKYALQSFFDKVVEKYPSILDYKIYYNNSFYQWMNTKDSFVCANPLLERGRYYYGVSSISDDGEETDATIICEDCRWWDIGSTGYIILKWDSVPNIHQYKIYRGTSEDQLAYLQTVSHTIFVDDGSLLPSGVEYAKTINFTSFDRPTNVYAMSFSQVTDYYMETTKTNSILIRLFLDGATELSNVIIHRIQLILSKFLPSEIRYTLQICNDNETSIYTSLFYELFKYLDGLWYLDGTRYLNGYK